MTEQTHPRKIYFLIAASLLALLALTVALSFVDLGAWNFFAAITIAAIKAILVILFFMEVRSSGQIVWVMVTASLVWLLLLFGGTFSDYLSRNASPSPASITSYQKIQR